MGTSIQEARWVLRAQCDDREALECLLRSAQPALHRYLCGVVGTTSSSDVLQEVLITISRKLGALHDPELFRAWAYRIASRLAFRHLKREKRWREQGLDESALESMAANESVPPDAILKELLSALERINEVKPLYLKGVLQKDFVEVNEKGTEAAAVTEVFCLAALDRQPPPPPFEMIVDRPFVFAICDDFTRAMVFLGAVVDPLATR